MELLQLGGVVDHSVVLQRRDLLGLHILCLRDSEHVQKNVHLLYGLAAKESGRPPRLLLQQRLGHAGPGPGNWLHALPESFACRLSGLEVLLGLLHLRPVLFHVLQVQRGHFAHYLAPLDLFRVFCDELGEGGRPKDGIKINITYFT